MDNKVFDTNSDLPRSWGYKMSMRHTQQKTKPRAGRPRNPIRLLAEATDFLLIVGVQTRPLTFYSMATGGHFHGDKTTESHTDKNLHLVPRLRMRGNIPAFLPHAFTSWRLITHTDNSNFTISCVPSPATREKAVYEHNTQRYCTNA